MEKAVGMVLVGSGRRMSGGMGEEHNNSSEVNGMGKGGKLDSCMRGKMKRGVQRLCLLPAWWR